MKATIRVLILLEKQDLPICFEYRRASERCAVFEMYEKLFGTSQYQKTIFEGTESHNNKKQIMHDIFRSDNLGPKILGQEIFSANKWWV